MTRPKGSKNKKRGVKGLPPALQIVALKKRFKKLNPNADIKEVDFKAAVGRRETFSENLYDLKAEYPMFRWDRREDPSKYDRMNDAEHKAELRKAGYAVIKKRDYNLLLSTYKAKVKQREKARKKAKVKPGARRSSSKLILVRKHKRRYPRR